MGMDQDQYNEYNSDFDEQVESVRKRSKRRVTIQEPSNIERHHAKYNITIIPYRSISFGEFVGRGTFGVVYQGEWEDKQVAIKFIGPRSSRKDAIPKEVMLLSKVNHKNIINFYGYSKCKANIFLIMEYADCGSLYDIIHRHHPEYGSVDYTPAHVINWALQTAEAVEYLHGIKPRPIIHRDLKPSNILLQNECEVVKICDFGEARIYHSEMTNGCGTPLWMAPEVIEGTKYTEKCDVYSFGIILWEMLARKKPFYDLEVEGQGIFLAVYKGLRPSQVKTVPAALQFKIDSCWIEDADIRPTFTELVHFLRLAFNCVHEGDEELFDVVDPSHKESWYVWSDAVIQLEFTHRCENEEAEDKKLSTMKTHTRTTSDQAFLKNVRDISIPQSPSQQQKKRNFVDNSWNNFRKIPKWLIPPCLVVSTGLIIYFLSKRKR